MRRIAMPVVFLCAAVTASVGAAVARADGLPVLGVDVGGSGVISPAGGPRYVTLPAGDATLVAGVNPAGGQIETSTLVPGTFTIPAVAYDGSAAGLSGDRRTLVLIEPRTSFPRARTRLLVLRAPSLRVRKFVTLQGDFSFDAVSPHGSLVYLIQYVSPSDPTRYVVRSYGLAAGRLLSEPVTDPRERGEAMRGSPLTRATGADGRWAYTLYDGAGKTPFVHALDTSGRTARCIDLDGLVGADLGRARLRLNPAGTLLTVSDRGRALAAIDTLSFTAGRPATPGSGSQWPWAPFAYSIGAVLLVAGALSVLRRRRYSGSPGANSSASELMQ